MEIAGICYAGRRNPGCIYRATTLPERIYLISGVFISSWVFSIYNVYSRLNPYFIYYDQTYSAYEGTLKVKAKLVSLFPIIPSVTWNFKF